MRPPSGVIALHLTSNPVLSQGRAVPLPVRFSYKRERPFTVLLEDAVTRELCNAH
ncbi:hypothetical protein [Streptomyces rubrogriseus]|uniref:hypothetical protein n=1 Tax=Streptomyces rubrogriseus TaxID=194673 RepID=UPI0036AC0A3B